MITFTKNQKQEEQKDLFMLVTTTIMTVIMVKIIFMMKINVLLQKLNATT
jgi:hypothetical protein